MYGSRGCLGCCSKPTPIIAVDEPSKGLKIQGRTVKKPSFSEDFWSTSTYEMDNSGVQSQRSISSISTSTQAHDLHGAVSTSSTSEFVNHGLLLWNQTRRQWMGNRKPDNHVQHVREPGLSMTATFEEYLALFGEDVKASNIVDCNFQMLLLKIKPCRGVAYDHVQISQHLFYALRMVKDTYLTCLYDQTDGHLNSPAWAFSWNATYDSLLGTNKPFPQPIPLSEMVDFLVDVWEQEGMYD